MKSGFGLVTSGGVANNAPVAAKAPARVKSRLTADAEVAQCAIARQPLNADISKCSARFRVGEQSIEHFRITAKLFLLPGHFAQQVLHGQRARGVGIARVLKSHQSQLFVELPVGINSDDQQAAEAALTFVGGLAVPGLKACKCPSRRQTDRQQEQLQGQRTDVVGARRRAARVRHQVQHQQTSCCKARVDGGGTKACTQAREHHQQGQQAQCNVTCATLALRHNDRERAHGDEQHGGGCHAGIAGAG